MTDGMGQHLKKVGSRFAFEFFLEMWKPKFIEMLTKWLSPYTVEDLDCAVKKGTFLDISSLNLAAVKPYLEYVEKISVERLLEDYLAPVRPDLVQALQEMGMPGAQWLVKLREHLLNQIRGAAQTVKEDIVQANCDACSKSWPVPRDEFDKIESCPFCGHKQGEEVSESYQPSLEESPEGPPRVVIDIEEA